VLKSINEKDFDKMHRTQITAYGWVDNPPILPDITKVIENMYLEGGGRTRLIQLPDVI
jgi:hypothetical protein